MQAEADAEAWRAHCRNVVAIVEGTVVGETAPEEPVMAGEVVRVEAEAESEPVGASDVRSAEPAASTQPVVASEAMEREATVGEGGGVLPGGSWAKSAVDPRVTEKGGVMRLEAKLRARDGSLKGASVTFKPGERFRNSNGRFKREKEKEKMLSADEISGEYFPEPECRAFPTGDPGTCNSCYSSITVMPHGPDAIETLTSSWAFFPIGCFGGNILVGSVFTRRPTADGYGTNAFNEYGYPMRFSADGSFQHYGKFRRRPGSQKRAFQKVETRDIAGDWCTCHLCLPVPLWPLSPYYWTTKEALDEDRYEEKGRAGILCFPIIPISTETYTRKYVNGHPTNGFVRGRGGLQTDTHWYRDSDCAGRPMGCYFEKKIG
jgi:hypothetical protein